MELLEKTTAQEYHDNQVGVIRASLSDCGLPERTSATARLKLRATTAKVSEVLEPYFDDAKHYL